MSNGKLSNEVKGISEDEVGDEVQNRVYGNSTEINCVKESNGKWTIRND